MTKYFKDNRDVVRFVSGLLKRSKPDSQLTITIGPGKSGGFSVSTVTDTSSESTPILICSTAPPTISAKEQD